MTKGAGGQFKSKKGPVTRDRIYERSQTSNARLDSHEVCDHRGHTAHHLSFVYRITQNRASLEETSSICAGLANIRIQTFANLPDRMFGLES